RSGSPSGMMSASGTVASDRGRVPGQTARRAERTGERLLGARDPRGGQQSGSEGGAEVGEGLLRRVARVVVENRTHPGGVHATSVGQELDLLRGEVREP